MKKKIMTLMIDQRFTKNMLSSLEASGVSVIGSLARVQVLQNYLRVCAFPVFVDQRMERKGQL